MTDKAINGTFEGFRRGEVNFIAAHPRKRVWLPWCHVSWDKEYGAIFYDTEMSLNNDKTREYLEGISGTVQSNGENSGQAGECTGETDKD